MISSKETFPASTPGINLCTCKSEETVNNDLVIHIFSIFQLIQIGMDQLPHTVSTEQCCPDELRVLKIYLILLVIAVVCKFCIACYIDLAHAIRGICHCKIPHFIRLIQRNIVSYFWMDLAIISHHLCVCCTMMTFALIRIQIFSYRLPGSWPIIFTLLIS